MMTIVQVPASADDRKKSWRKELVQVDRTTSNGYAFIGPWLRGGERAELAVGAIVLGYDEPGSMKNWYPQVRAWRVTEATDGTYQLEEIFKYVGARGERSWALAVRDELAALLEEQLQADADAELPIRLYRETDGEEQPTEPLAAYTTDELLAELRRREALP